MQSAEAQKEAALKATVKKAHVAERHEKRKELIFKKHEKAKETANKRALRAARRAWKKESRKKKRQAAVRARKSERKKKKKEKKNEKKTKRQEAEVAKMIHQHEAEVEKKAKKQYAATKEKFDKHAERDKKAVRKAIGRGSAMMGRASAAVSDSMRQAATLALRRALRRTVRFKPSSFQFRDAAARRIMRKVAATMKRFPKVAITVVGHSPAHGHHGLRLSRGRAGTAVRYLRAHGCTNRITTRWEFGHGIMGITAHSTRKGRRQHSGSQQRWSFGHRQRRTRHGSRRRRHGSRRRRHGSRRRRFFASLEAQLVESQVQLHNAQSEVLKQV